MPCKGASDAPVWVALEKLHGAQLVIDVDADGVRFAKRKAWLRDDEPFFGWQLIRASLREAARSAFAKVGAPRLVLYGELYGGGYPGLDRGLQPVQTGVWYAPDLRWALFEARAVDGPRDEFLSWSESSALGIPMPPLLLRGRKVDVDALSERFPSRVGAALGFPPLEGNLAEGLVQKPDVRMPATSYTASKRKIAEMREDRFDESRPWDPSRRLELEALIEWAARMTNPPRIASAASKVGRDDPKALADEVVLDVLSDLEEAFPGAMRSLPCADLSALEAAIRRVLTK
jgi:hypothetical protein